MQETHGEAGAAENAGGEGSLKLRPPQDEVVSNLDEGSLNLRRPTLCSNSYINNPPNPPDGEAAETGEREGDDLDGWFEAFQRSYPFDATMSLSEALAQGRKLSIKDRAKALRWAGEYAADVRKRGATRPLDAARWLRERRFDEIDRLKGGQAKAQGRERPMVHVAVGTRAWDAWIRHGHKPGLNMSRHQGKNGWFFPSLWPPGCDPPADEAGAA